MIVSKDMFRPHKILHNQQNIIPTLIFVRVGMGYGEWHQKSAPFARIPAVHTRRRPEERFSEDMGSEVIDIKRTGV
jgi:hypothetical protein